MDNKGYVLALYDFRSKQEYIYRTNKIMEISGASELLKGAYDEFIKTADITDNKDSDFAMRNFDNNAACSHFSGEVIYNGGGNLMVLYKNHDEYIKANKAISKYIREKLFTANIIVCYVPYTGNFAEDRRNLYKANTLKKNTGNVTIPYSVFPFTQVDRETFMPITNKDTQNNESHTCRSNNPEKLCSSRTAEKRMLVPVIVSDHVPQMPDAIIPLSTDSNFETHRTPG